MLKMNEHSVSSQLAIRALAASLLLMLVLVSAGCSGNRTPLEVLAGGISPETPGQVARSAFNVYDADVRRDSVNKLAATKFGGEPAYLRLYRLLIDDPDPTVRAACCKALGLHGQVQDIELLLPRVYDTATPVRWEAAKALQKIHSPSAMEPLGMLLASDEDADVRQAAAIALGQYPTIAVFNQLVGALDDRTYSVVGAAHQSLHTLTGQDYGTSGSDWLIFARKDPKAIFADRLQYTWQPYVKPRTFWDKMQFWKKKPLPPEPQVPRGLTPLESQDQAQDVPAPSEK